MRYRAEVEERPDGRVIARCPELGVSGEGRSRSEALGALRDAARYALEVCPCDTTAGTLELDVVERRASRS